MKISIIGFSGAGKSTLAKRLADHYQLDILYLDTVQFYDDWKVRSVQQQVKLTKQFVAKHDNWVIDGNYMNVYPERFDQSDMIFFLDYNRITCFYNAFTRYLNYRGRKRECLGCKEKFDLEFIKWLLIDGRKKKRRIQLLEMIKRCPGEKYHVRNRRQLENIIKELMGL